MSLGPRAEPERINDGMKRSRSTAPVLALGPIAGFFQHEMISK